MNRNVSKWVPFVLALLHPILSPRQGVAQEPQEGYSDSGNIHFVIKQTEEKKQFPEKLPNGDTYLVERTTGQLSQIFLSPKDHPDEEIKLYETAAPQVEIHFSP